MTTRKQLFELTELHQMLRDGRARCIRRRAGLAAVEVASVLDVSYQSVFHWEAGHRYPKQSTALRYLRLLKELEERIS